MLLCSGCRMLQPSTDKSVHDIVPCHQFASLRVTLAFPRFLQIHHPDTNLTREHLSTARWWASTPSSPAAANSAHPRQRYRAPSACWRASSSPSRPTCPRMRRRRQKHSSTSAPPLPAQSPTRRLRAQERAAPECECHGFFTLSMRLSILLAAAEYARSHTHTNTHTRTHTYRRTLVVDSALYHRRHLPRLHGAAAVPSMVHRAMLEDQRPLFC